MSLSRAVLVALVVAGLSGEAHAGAWTLEEGKGLAIVTATKGESTSRFTVDREREDVPAYMKEELEVLLEYGLTDRLTLRAKGAYRTWRQDEGDPPGGQGFGAREVGGRYRLIQRGGFVGSAEASLRVAEAHRRRSALEYEMRLLGGYGFEIAGRSAFVDAQAGYRLRPEASGDEMLADFTFGIRPHERSLLLLQTFSTIAGETGQESFVAYDEHKVQASAVFDVTQAIAVQVGLNRTVSGTEISAQEGAFGAVWLRF